jgi:magnesium transporter
VHAIESLEANRDVIAGMLDIYLSAVSNRVNQEVRALTVVAIIFMPATLISGIFGMNFKTHAAARPAGGLRHRHRHDGDRGHHAIIVFWRRRWLK